MEKLFVSYSIALELKKKGFDEDVIAYYDVQDNNKLKPIPSGEEINSFHANRNKLMVASPLYQQVLDWLRNTHTIDICHELDFYNHPIHTNGDWKYMGYECCIWKNREIEKDLSGETFDDYYKLMDYAIREALKLI